MQGMSDPFCQEHVTTAAVTAVVHPLPFSLTGVSFWFSLASHKVFPFHSANRRLSHKQSLSVRMNDKYRSDTYTAVQKSGVGMIF